MSFQVSSWRLRVLRWGVLGLFFSKGASAFHSASSGFRVWGLRVWGFRGKGFGSLSFWAPASVRCACDDDRLALFMGTVGFVHTPQPGFFKSSWFRVQGLGFPPGSFSLQAVCRCCSAGWVPRARRTRPAKPRQKASCLELAAGRRCSGSEGSPACSTMRGARS